MMKIKQDMDLLLWIRRNQTKNDVAPLYIRVTIDGISKEISLGVKINPKDWDIKSKRVKKTEPSYKTTNSKIIQAQVDLDRHFNGLKTQVDRVTPDMVKNAYLGKSEAKVNTEKSEKGKDTPFLADVVFSCNVLCGFNSIAFFENCPCVSNKHPFHSLLFRLKFAL